MSVEQRLLTTNQAAERLGLSRRTLESWRLTGNGPQFRRIGPRLVRYDSVDLQAFVDAQVQRSTSDPGGPAREARTDKPGAEA